MNHNRFSFFDFSSPPISYAATWLLLLYLYNLKIISYYEDLKSLTAILIFSTIGTYFISWFILRLLKPIKPKVSLTSYPNNFENSFSKILKKTNRIWIIGVVITIILQKGFPLLWILIRIDKSYGDFGFASIHGFLTSFWLFGLLGYYILFLKSGKRKYLNYVLLFFLFPVISVNRGAFILGACEIFAAFLFFRYLSYKKVLKIILGVLIVFYAFGAVGDFRVGYKMNFLNEIVSEDYQELFGEYLPSGFTWGYLYFTGSLDNINANIDKLEPNYIPYNSIATLFPSVIRDLIWQKTENYDTNYVMKMTNPLVNTFTYIAGFLVDFGILGTIIMVFIIQFFINRLYIKAKSGHIGAQIAYIPILASIFLSVFADYLFTLVVIFQVILGYWTGKFYKSFNPYNV